MRRQAPVQFEANGETVMRTRSGSNVIDQNQHELLRAAAISFAAAAMVALLMLVADGTALSAQDKYTVQVPKGLSFSEFRGYEDWQVVAVSQAGDLIEVIVANPEMINAYRSVPPTASRFPTAPGPRRSTGTPGRARRRPSRRQCRARSTTSTSW